MCPPHRHASVQALVLVYDPAKPHTWTAVESWHHYISRYNPSILLVLANHTTPSATSPAPSLPTPISWCSEHGCEHIIIPHGNTLTPSTDTQGLTSETSDRDMGCVRVVDAMHANIWEVMERKQVNMGGMGAVDEDEDEAQDEAEEDTRESKQDVVEQAKSHNTPQLQEPEKEREQDSPDDDIPHLIPKQEQTHKSDADANGMKKTKNARKNQRKREKKKERAAVITATTSTIALTTSTSIASVPSSSSSSSSSSLPDPTEFDTMSESDMERSLESFSAMFDRVRGIRDQAASGNMSDQARRAQAAAAIMSMLQGLGIQDEAEDGSDTEEPTYKPFGPEPPTTKTYTK